MRLVWPQGSRPRTEGEEVTDFCRVCDKQSDHPTHLHNLVGDIRIIAGTTYVGNTPYPNVVLAQKHAHEWQTHSLPVRDSERGGSSSPVELEERAEDRRVAAQAARDAQDLPGLLLVFEQEWILGEAAHAPKFPVQVAEKAVWHVPVTPELSKAAERFARVVARCVRVVDHDKIGGDECRSCARKGKVGNRVYQGHKGIAIYERVPRQRLCYWCWSHWTAEKRLPPIDVVDIYHRVGPRAAGLELAKRLRRTTNGSVASPPVPSTPDDQGLHEGSTPVPVCEPMRPPQHDHWNA